jgi:hypothetical protein
VVGITLRAIVSLNAAKHVDCAVLSHLPRNEELKGNVMQAGTEYTKMTTLTLTIDEAMWLRDYMQNSFCDPADECEEDREMRTEMFTLLSKENLR